VKDYQFWILVILIAPMAYIAWIGVINDIQVALHNRKLKKQLADEERLHG